MSAQAERRIADDHAGDHADHHSDRDADPGRDVELHQEQRHRVRAEAEERRMAERDEARVAAEDIPGKAHDRPDQHERQHQLVVLVLHEQPDDEIRHAERRDRGERLRPALACAGHVRSTLRPRRPCGRIRTISRNTTKIAAFWSCTGSTSVESCCTSPIVSPPQNAPTMLPMPPSTTPAYMMITKSRPT